PESGGYQTFRRAGQVCRTRPSGFLAASNAGEIVEKLELLGRSLSARGLIGSIGTPATIQVLRDRDSQRDAPSGSAVSPEVRRGGRNAEHPRVAGHRPAG